VLLDRAEESGVGAVALVSDGGPLGGALVEVSTGRAVAVTPVASLSDSDAGRPPEILTAGVVVCDADPVAAGEAVAMLRTAGWRGEFWGGPSLAASAFAAVAGDAAEGAQYLTPYPFPQDVTGTAGFAEAYTAIAPHVPPPGPLALPAYEAFWILLDALEADLAANGEPTRDGVAGALTSVELPDFQLYWYRVGRGGAISLEGVVPRSIPRS
jgi:hypothetical protein